jgi:hypothetical protein
MNMDNDVSVEGSAARARDRGNGEDMGFPTSEKPSLGDPRAVQALVQDFLTEVLDIRASHFSGKLKDGDASDRVLALCIRYGDIIMGAPSKYVVMPWNSKEFLGEKIVEQLPEAEKAPGAGLFMALAGSILEAKGQHELGDIDDATAEKAVTDAIESVTALILGAQV